MDSQIYNDILYQFFVPFALNHKELKFVHQDNDSKHASAINSEVFGEFAVEWV